MDRELQQEYVAKYYDLGIDTVALKEDGPGKDGKWEEGKKPFVDGWQKMEPKRVWPNDWLGGNIGFRSGGKNHFVIIDCDEKNQPGTFDKVVVTVHGVRQRTGAGCLFQ